MIADSTNDAFDELIAVTLKGLLSCLKYEIAAMRSGGGGSIVNMSSVTSDITAVAGNCEPLARSLFEQRALDWLDEALPDPGA